MSLDPFRPLTEGQAQAKIAYESGRHVVMCGYAGTGKTYVGLRMALEDIVNNQVERLHIFRSAVPSRDIGFLPGTESEKMSVYEKAYNSLFREIFQRSDAWEIAKQKGVVSLESTSFLRGTTYKDCTILIDEAQNLSSQELTTILTRVGENCRVIVCGDALQCDLPMHASGWNLLMKVAPRMKDFITVIEYGSDDIVRGEFVKQFILSWQAVLSDTRG